MPPLHSGWRMSLRFRWRRLPMKPRTHLIPGSTKAENLKPFMIWEVSHAL
jgi:hypothetical protein